MGEQAQIEKIRRASGTAPHVLLGIGDDAAVMEIDGPLVTSCDLLVDGVHFRRSTAAAADIGHKAAAVNLSDIAAMGARPRGLLVALTLAPGHPDVEELYRGLSGVGDIHGAPVVGGDISVGECTSLAVTALGDLPDGAQGITRDGALAGDTVWLTGALGASAAGFRLLEMGESSGHEGLVASHLRPEPRVQEGIALARAGATAMIDVSDGLALDSARLGQASGVDLRIDAARVPVAPGLDTLAKEWEVPLDVLALTGGEDYELLVTGSDDLDVRSGVALSRVGEVSAGRGATLLRGGQELDLGSGGWLHAV